MGCNKLLLRDSPFILSEFLEQCRMHPRDVLIEVMRREKRRVESKLQSEGRIAD